MPTYQYACTECGHAFEQVQAFSDEALTTCPECTGRLRKIFNAVGVVFKGSGFYRTDSRSNGSATESGSGSADTTKTETKSDATKTESTSGTKTESTSGTKTPAASTAGTST